MTPALHPGNHSAAATDHSNFLSGVIEGFYGPPWSLAERQSLFRQMAAWGLNTYFYCPKDDAKNRAIWREPYSEPERNSLQQTLVASHRHGIHFFYGISPGLDIRYSDDADFDLLHQRLNQMLAIGCQHFALLFDDIPDRMSPEDTARWTHLASAQCAVVNALFQRTREHVPGARFLVCPTPYCGRMAAAKHGGDRYLELLGQGLEPEIDVLWTGPDIVSREISLSHVQELTRVLRRKPVIWDNLHANDYDGRRFFCGPYSGRPLELRDAVRGVLTNPNCEFPLNFIAIRTLAAFARAQPPWDPRAAYLEAMREWQPSFASSGRPFDLQELILLGDCYYLPHSEGPEAAALHARITDLLSRPPESWGASAEPVLGDIARLKDVCARMAELKDRALFWALNRRIWELREELDLLERFIRHRLQFPDRSSPCTSDFHLPGTYRGGIVPRLQKLLDALPSGEFIAAADRP